MNGGGWPARLVGWLGRVMMMLMTMTVMMMMGTTECTPSQLSLHASSVHVRVPWHVGAALHLPRLRSHLSQ